MNESTNELKGYRIARLRPKAPVVLAAVVLGKSSGSMVPIVQDAGQVTRPGPLLDKGPGRIKWWK